MANGLATDLAALTEMWGPPVVGRHIPLRRRDGSIRAMAIVDGEDWERLSAYNWHCQVKGYAARSLTLENGKRATELLHRAVFGLAPSDPAEVEHKSRDRLDCRKENLRLCTHAQNMQNRSPNGHRGATSSFRGVTHDKRGYWVAQARLNGKQHFLGHYDSERLAGMAAARWRHEHMTHTVEDPALLGGSYEDVPRSSALGRRFREQIPVIQAMWADGYPMKEIAVALGVTSPALGGIMSRMRREGHDLPHRRPHKGYSKHRGVTWSKAHKRWKAQVAHEGKTKYLGLFQSEDEAAEAVAAFRQSREKETT